MASDPRSLYTGGRQGIFIEVRPAYLFQDAAATTPVTADGDPVNYVEDQSGNGNHLVKLPGAVSGATYKTDGTLHWLAFGGSQGLQTSAGTAFMSGNPYAVGAGFVFTSGGNDQFFFTTSSDASGGSSSAQLKNSIVHVGKGEGGDAKIGHWYNDVVFSYTFSTTAAEVHQAEFLDPGCAYYVNGTLLGSSGSVPNLPIDQIGKAAVFVRSRYDGYSSPDYAQGRLYGLVMIDDTITSGERSDINDYLQVQIGAAPTSQTVSVGQAVETDSSSSLGGAKVAHTGQAVETGSAGAVAAIQSRVVAVGQAVETDAAMALSGAKTRAVGQAVETDTALGVLVVGQAKLIPVGQAVETDAAMALSGAKTRAVGRAVETDTGAAVTARKRRRVMVGRAVETDTARPVTYVHRRRVGQVREIDRAFSLSSGLAPFWWTVYSEAVIRRRSRRRLRPLVFTDRVDGATYVLRLAPGLLLSLAPLEPKRFDEVYPAYSEPVIAVDGRSIRVFVENGVLRFEEYEHDVRIRPILFGKDSRPEEGAKLYRLRLPADAV